MAKFIETTDGVFLNLDHVRYLRPASNKEGPDHLVAFTGDETYQIYSSAEDVLYPVVPAQPGFVLLRISFSDDSVPDNLADYVCRTPIIAWRMKPWVDPVALDDFASDLAAVQCPGGQINMLYDADFANYGAFLAEVRTRWQKHIDAKKKVALTIVKPE